MPIAAIYDIHGNLPALEAVLDEIEAEQVDRIVVGGDVIPGPMPRETLDRLLGLKARINFIRGNGEVAILQQLNGQSVTSVPEAVRPIIEWTARQLELPHQKVLPRWPATLQIDSPSLGPILFCHATPRNENEIFTRDTPNDRLLPVFAGVDAAIVVCGHTHMQFDRYVGDVRIVNAGSVGMPFGRPGAYWLLLDASSPVGDSSRRAPTDIQFRRTEYDLEKAAARIRACSYPQAEQFATNNILNPPSEEQMREVFRKSEIA